MHNTDASQLSDSQTQANSAAYMPEIPVFQLCVGSSEYPTRLAPDDKIHIFRATGEIQFSRFTLDGDTALLIDLNEAGVRQSLRLAQGGLDDFTATRIAAEIGRRFGHGIVRCRRRTARAASFLLISPKRAL